MCSDCSEVKVSFFTRGRKEGKQARPMGAGGGHAGVQLGFVHLPSPRAPQPPFRGCFLLKLPQSKATAAKVAAGQSGGQANPVCQPPFLLLCYVRGLGRVSTSPRSPRWPCCQPAAARSRGPQLLMFHVHLAWKESPGPALTSGLHGAGGGPLTETHKDVAVATSLSSPAGTATGSPAAGQKPAHTRAPGAQPSTPVSRLLLCLASPGASLLPPQGSAMQIVS